MKALFKTFLGFFIGSVILVTAVLVLDSQGFFNLKSVKVKNQFKESVPAVARWSTQLEMDLQEFIGASLIELPFEKIKDKIRPLEWVQDYHIHRKFPANLQIELIPKEWIALFPQDATGKYLGVSSRCELLPELNFLDTKDLPFVSNIFKEDAKKRQSMCDFLNAANEGSHIQKNNINFIKWKGLELVVELIEPKVEIRLGHEDLITAKNRIEKVLQDLEKKSLTPSVITAVAGQKVVVKLRKPR
ncbi:MAG: hypothetical protein VX642_10760 [Bdellovibrionota bacterium]|nr:hypothetical protein [Bdellovibrionota bacterium]